MPLTIKYSEKLERIRIKNSIENLPWFDKFGYVPRFPKNIDPRVDDLKKVFDALKNEYKEEEYQKVAKEIKKYFSKVEKQFFRKMEMACGKKIRRKFTLVLTKYGVGGSYHPPDKIVFNFKMKNSILNTILHEIVHLTIEPHIQKFHIQQMEKERIVDLILASEPMAWPGYKMQNCGEKFKNSIDPLFKESFKPPIVDFFRKLAED